MKEEIKVPPMGESISEATISAFLKPPGSQVQMDDELLELATDKVNQVLYAPQAGIFTPIVKEEDTVIIGQVIGYIETAGVGKTQEPKKIEPEIKPSEAATVARKEEAKIESSTKVKIPKKEAAGEARIATVDFLRQGPEEGMVKTTVAPSIAPQVAATPISEPSRNVPAQDRRERESRRKMTRIRKVIAQRLVQVQNTAAMLTTFNEVDLTALMSVREKYRDSFEKIHGVRLGLMSFFVTAVVTALRKFPQLNSYIDGEEIVERHYFDIGIAVGTEKGLVVPVVRNCDQLSMAQIEKSITDYATKAKNGTLTADDLSGAGFTITNGGVYGSLLSTPILSPQQCGILGMHKIAKRPMVVDDNISIRQMMYLALSYDHRIIDGKEAVTFLVEIKNLLEEPMRFLLNL